MPKQRIDVELWTRLKDLGIRNTVRSRRRRLQRDHGLPLSPYTTGAPAIRNYGSVFGVPFWLMFGL